MMTFSENSLTGEYHNDIQRKLQKRHNVILTLVQNGTARVRHYDIRGKSGKWVSVILTLGKIKQLGECHYEGLL